MLFWSFKQIIFSGFTFVCVGMCVFDYLCAVKKSGVGGRALKLRALLLCILLCDLEKTLRLFIAEELMLPRINMAKSSYQLYNGQATEVKTTALTMRVCVYVFMYCVCVCSHLPSFLICAGVCTLLDICFFCFFVFFDSFNQRRVVKRCGASVSLPFFLR